MSDLAARMVIALEHEAREKDARIATLTARCAELAGTEEELREIIREFLSFEMSAEFKDSENDACWCEAIRTARAALAKVTT